MKLKPLLIQSAGMNVILCKKNYQIIQVSLAPLKTDSINNCYSFKAKSIKSKHNSYNVLQHKHSDHFHITGKSSRHWKIQTFPIHFVTVSITVKLFFLIRCLQRHLPYHSHTRQLFTTIHRTAASHFPAMEVPEFFPDMRCSIIFPKYLKIFQSLTPL